jgi:hypothetical protein
MFHQERDGIATFATTKTFKNLFGRGYGKRGCFFVVKRTEAQVIGSAFLKLHKFSHDIHDINATGDLLYGVGRNHGTGEKSKVKNQKLKGRKDSRGHSYSLLTTHYSLLPARKYNFGTGNWTIVSFPYF